jgi:RimJ/RimL family protein N-acetyltransferase
MIWGTASLALFWTTHYLTPTGIMMGQNGRVQIFLETERLTLRRFTEADVEHLVDLDSDLEVLRYINGGTPTPRDVIEREILPRFLAYYDRYNGYGFWAAIERTTGEFLGWFCLHPEDEDKDRVALGYRLRRSAWGKGYATEGAQALIRKGFTELGMRRVFAGTYEYNVASMRVMEKVGMKLVRVYRPTPEQLASAKTFVATPGVIWDGNDVEYELGRDDWEREHALP